MLDGSSSPSSSKSKRGSSEDTFGWARVVLLGAVVIWQVYTLGRLGAYASHLVEARDRHEELQGSLRDAQVALSVHGRNLVLGAFLSPKERDAFAAALGAAIDTARRPVRPAQEPGGSSPQPA